MSSWGVPGDGDMAWLIIGVNLNCDISNVGLLGPSFSLSDSYTSFKTQPKLPSLTLRHLWISSITFLFSSTPENSGCDSSVVLSFFPQVLSPYQDLHLLRIFSSFVIHVLNTCEALGMLMCIWERCPSPSKSWWFHGWETRAHGSLTSSS